MGAVNGHTGRICVVGRSSFLKALLEGATSAKVAVGASSPNAVTAGTAGGRLAMAQDS